MPPGPLPGKVKNYTDFTMLDAIYGTYLDQDDIGTIVIVTGDGHFSSVVARLRVRCKKNIVVVGIPHFINRELYQSASEVRELEIDADACLVDREDLIAFVKNSIRTHPYVTLTNRQHLQQSSPSGRSGRPQSFSGSHR